MNSALQPGSIPKPQTALFPRVFAQESPRFSTFVFNRFRILPSSVGCKSFACHSYENCRVCTNNFHSETQRPQLTAILSSRDEKRVTASPLESVFADCDGCKSFRIRFYENCRVSLGVTPAFVKNNFSYADVSTGRNNLSHRLGPKSSRAYWMPDTGCRSLLFQSPHAHSANAPSGIFGSRLRPASRARTCATDAWACRSFFGCSATLNLSRSLRCARNSRSRTAIAEIPTRSAVSCVEYCKTSRSRQTCRSSGASCLMAYRWMRSPRCETPRRANRPESRLGSR